MKSLLRLSSTDTRRTIKNRFFLIFCLILSVFSSDKRSNPNPQEIYEEEPKNRKISHSGEKVSSLPATNPSDYEKNVSGKFAENSEKRKLSLDEKIEKIHKFKSKVIKLKFKFPSNITQTNLMGSFVYKMIEDLEEIFSFDKEEDSNIKDLKSFEFFLNLNEVFQSMEKTFLEPKKLTKKNIKKKYLEILSWIKNSFTELLLYYESRYHFLKRLKIQTGEIIERHPSYIFFMSINKRLEGYPGNKPSHELFQRIKNTQNLFHSYLSPESTELMEVYENNLKDIEKCFMEGINGNKKHLVNSCDKLIKVTEDFKEGYRDKKQLKKNLEELKSKIQKENLTKNKGEVINEEKIQFVMKIQDLDTKYKWINMDDNKFFIDSVFEYFNEKVQEIENKILFMKIFSKKSRIESNSETKTENFIKDKNLI